MFVFKKRVYGLFISCLLIFSISLFSCNNHNSNSSINDESKYSTLIVSDGIIGGNIKISATSYNESNNTVIKGQNVSITAINNDGYKFDNITLNGQTYSDATTFTFNASENTYYIDAHFSIESGISKIEITGDQLVGINKNIQLEANLIGAGGYIKWSSSNQARATVSQTGLVTGKSAGVVNINATSIIDPNTTTSYSIFVMPSYFENMINTYNELDFATGQQFEGNIKINLENLINTNYVLPYTFDLSYNKEAESKSDLYKSTKFHLNIGMDLNNNDDSLVSSYLNEQIKKLLKENLSFLNSNQVSTISDLDLYYLNENELHTCVTHDGIYNAQTAKIDETSSKYVLEYSKNDLGSVVGTLFFKFLPTLLDMDLEENNEDSSEIFEALDAFLVYGNTGEEGIYVSEIALTLINSYLNSYLEENETLKTIINSLFSEITDIRLKFIENSSTNKFESLKFTITVKKDKQNIFDTAYDPYDLLTINFQINEPLSSDYFIQLQTELSNKATQANSISSVQAKLNTLSSIYSEVELDNDYTICFNDITYAKLIKNTWSEVTSLGQLAGVLSIDNTNSPLPILTITNSSNNQVISPTWDTTSKCLTYQLEASKTYSYTFSLYGFDLTNEMSLDFNTQNNTTSLSITNTNFLGSIETTSLFNSDVTATLKIDNLYYTYSSPEFSYIFKI